MNKHWAHRVNVNKAAGLVHGFRSGLEQKNAKFLEDRGIPVLFELLRIPYLVPEKTHKYTPDFELPNGIIPETKGLFENNDRAKHLLIRAQFPELDIRFVFTNPEAKLYKGSSTTYAMWCTKNGFKYAKGLIPEEWINEPGPTKKPAEVIKAGPHPSFLTVGAKRAA